jgi:coatomer subunit beta
MIRKAVRTKPEDRGRYLKSIFSLLSSNSSAVQFESAHTLVSLSAAPTSVRAAASTYINLLIKGLLTNVTPVK